MINKIQDELVLKTIKDLIEYNTVENNFNKFMEECAELNEVMVKCITKKGSNKPKREKIVEETGDLLFRMLVYIEHNKLENEVLERLKTKSKQVQNYIKNKEYQGGA